ncbi:MAG TPA: dihydroorotase, partial [Gammaproteobacteria bacterium]|nr:dihydroorotase [Gammaproteobacteria bacterium]
MRILIKQGRLIDPTQNLNQIGDLYIVHGKIVSVDNAPDGFQPDHILLAHNHFVIPGLVDLYAHLNDSYGAVQLHEAAVAAKRGFTTLFCAPDGKMIRDSITRVEKFLESDVSYIDVLPIGALSEHLKGNAMSDLTALHAAGCCVFSNGIYPMQDLNFIRNLYLYA